MANTLAQGCGKRWLMLAALAGVVLLAAGCGRREDHPRHHRVSSSGAQGTQTAQVTQGVSGAGHISEQRGLNHKQALTNVHDYLSLVENDMRITSDSAAFRAIMSVADEMDAEWGMYHRLQNVIEGFAATFPTGCLMAIDAVCSNASLPVIRLMNLQGCKMRIMCALNQSANALALGRSLLTSPQSNTAVEAGIHYELERAARCMNDMGILEDVLRCSLQCDISRAQSGNRRAAASAAITAAQLASHYLECNEPASAAKVLQDAMPYANAQDEAREQVERLLHIAAGMQTNESISQFNNTHKELR